MTDQEAYSIKEIVKKNDAQTQKLLQLYSAMATKDDIKELGKKYVSKYVMSFLVPVTVTFGYWSYAKIEKQGEQITEINLRLTEILVILKNADISTFSYNSEK